ncbi:uncharacterized protein Glyat [Drosophila montana]|uniref:uncharacterized protein Glyat n=1 Tax=Drosophila montana TaxID=40370 RepID=UPI00313E73AA
MLAIAREQWLQLRDLYQSDRTNLTGYDLINSFICWSECGENVQIYVTDANWPKHGSFLLVHSFGNKAEIYFNTLGESLDQLQLMLSSWQLNMRHLFCGYENRFKHVVEHYWLGRGLSLGQLEHQGTFVYHLPHSEIKPLDLSPISDIKLGSLHSEHATEVDAHWPYRSNDSLILIRNLIRHNISAGAFNSEGHLLGWCLRSPHGSLCNLYVLPPHRRFGLASMLVRFMAQEIAATGAEVLATIVFNNEISRKLFDKLGFKHVHDVYWAVVPAS